MSEVLYRKWRPKRLGDVVGQETVTQTLRQAVALGRIAHAYLFCGPRGTGKTSTARILAKAINCKAPQDSEPDNECDICLAINEGRALDLIEIDAASNRGIDDIRNLSDKIRFTPNEARYKVYIIDEVHMLTEQAFNALLKTLEEPPGHAVFVLATTEAHKVPLTIISRCQRYDFRRIPLKRITAKLAALCEAEGVEASEEALMIVARTASGSLRDAENLLERVIVSYGSPVTEEQVRDLLELGGEQTALELAEHIVRKNIQAGLTLVNEVASHGSDLRHLHRSATECLRAVMLLKTKAGTSLGYTDEVTAKLTALADAAPLEHLVRALQIVAKADLRRDSSSPLPLELAVVESCTDMPTPQASQRPDVSGPPASQGAPRATTPRPQPQYQQPPAQSYRPPAQASQSYPSYARPQPTTEPASVSVPQDAPSEPAARLESQWKEITRALRHAGRKYKVGGLLNVCKEREVADGAIILKFSHRSNMERLQEELENPESRKALNDVLSQVMNGHYEVKMSVIDGGNGVTAQRASHQSHLVRAAQQMGARVVNEKEEEQYDEP
ncbi:MAG: DNA polymerase III subunit gamma/tau [Chloroflexi bacterium]|nr:DNA polymerase III subunit gamma/tau [Chloroflexota bacterium]